MCSVIIENCLDLRTQYDTLIPDSSPFKPVEPCWSVWNGRQWEKEQEKKNREKEREDLAISLAVVNAHQTCFFLIGLDSSWDVQQPSTTSQLTTPGWKTGTPRTTSGRSSWQQLRSRPSKKGSSKENMTRAAAVIGLSCWARSFPAPEASHGSFSLWKQSRAVAWDVPLVS